VSRSTVIARGLAAARERRSVAPWKGVAALLVRLPIELFTTVTCVSARCRSISVSRATRAAFTITFTWLAVRVRAGRVALGGTLCVREVAP
jgi:hypothetical protein